MLAMRFPLPDVGPESTALLADRLFDAVKEWSTLLEDWLDVALDEIRDDTPIQPFFPPGTRTRRRVDGLELDHIDEAKAVTELRAFPLRGAFKTVPYAFLAAYAWRPILDHVSAGREPPSDRLLLRDARVQLAERHSRRAVLDAATAAELSLTQMLDDSLTGLPSEIRELIRRGARQLGPLASTLHRLGVTLPDSLPRDLVELRNRVIHAGYQPSMDAARRTVQLAHDLVEQAQPLQRLLAADTSQG
jgi:hypothetical protein